MTAGTSSEAMTQARDTVVQVDLGERAYAIHIGRGLAVQNAGTLAALRPGGRAALVVDDNVDALHGIAVSEALERAGLHVQRIRVPAGEAAKSYAGLVDLCEAILAARIERGDLVVALGGGVTGDLAGFAAAIVRRGVRFVQMPTTLLAQVDSSVGGKTGINSAHGKNLVGAFHQPSLVIADTALLDTLPAREMRAGYAEVAKYGLIDDADFFAWCEANWRGIFAGGPEREAAVETSCRAKAAVVARDEREEGDRALLNLGHTFGHALERLTGYDGTRLVHGEAVAIGLAQAFRFSARLGLCDPNEAVRVEAHLRAVGLPTRIRDIPGFMPETAAMLDAMAQDKKVSRGELTFILARGIGRSFVARGVAAADVASFLETEPLTH